MDQATSLCGRNRSGLSYSSNSQIVYADELQGNLVLWVSWIEGCRIKTQHVKLN